MTGAYWHRGCQFLKFFFFINTNNSWRSRGGESSISTGMWNLTRVSDSKKDRSVILNSNQFWVHLIKHEGTGPSIVFTRGWTVLGTTRGIWLLPTFPDMVIVCICSIHQCLNVIKLSYRRKWQALSNFFIPTYSYRFSKTFFLPIKGLLSQVYS